MKQRWRLLPGRVNHMHMTHNLVCEYVNADRIPTPRIAHCLMNHYRQTRRQYGKYGAKTVCYKVVHDYIGQSEHMAYVHLVDVHNVHDNRP